MTGASRRVYRLSIRRLLESMMTFAQSPRVVTRTISSRPTNAKSQLADDLNVAHDGKRIAVSYRSPAALKPASRKLRRSAKGQVEALANNIRRFGAIVPLLVTGDGEVVDGNVRLDACISLNQKSVPTIVVDHLSPTEIRALRLSLNKLAERSVWDMDALAAEFEELFAVDPSLLHFTGFAMPEIDIAMTSFGLAGDQIDDDRTTTATEATVSCLEDVWVFEGGHKLLCGTARESASYVTLLGAEKVQMVLTDPPYGCPIKGHVSRKHREFVEGSGMSEAETLAFFSEFLQAMTPHLMDGAIADIFIDSQGMYPLLTAIRAVGLEQKTLVVWDKGCGGMGTLYRPQAEFVVVTKLGRAKPINNIELGRHGRNRTTVWSARGMAQFGKGRKEALQQHPTVKPVSLLVDALLDTSLIGGIVLDPFAGSGSLLIAAHRTRRIGRAIELDPAYVDVAVRRMEKATGQPAHHAATGLTFAEIGEKRGATAPTSTSRTAAHPLIQA